jgi:para-aminobenzoate synthetase / 4-amino-4-deoxychorismate lyase
VPAAVPSDFATAARAVRVALEGDVPAAHAARLVADDDRPFALAGRWAGASAIAGSEPLRTAEPGDDPFALLDALPPIAGAPAGFVGGGWFGALGYGLGRRLEQLGPPPPAPERLPETVLAFHDHVLRRDRDGRWWFEALWTDERAAALERRLEALRERVARGAPGARPAATGAWRATPGPEGHALAVRACQERIAAGDLFQANLSLRLRATLDGDPAELFARGVEALAPDRAAFFTGPWGAMASLSPELLVERHGEIVRSAPIKGTRPRPADPAAAVANRAELAASAKDRAENVMIVDLVRNDLGRVCEHGSVQVTALAEPRPHAGVWHLVSEVEGRRRAGVGDGELVAALFPPGSVTGAPKLAAMDVISELESASRQTFCGAIGLASPAAGLELSVAIRTFECRDGEVWLDVGGGIVADSDPAAEAAEALAKARPLLAAIGAPEPVAGAPDGPIAPVPRRLGPRPVPRPDPAAGVFETILVRGGRAVAAERHLARLAASGRELYGVELPPALAALVDHAALEQGGDCRLRVLLAAGGEVRLEAAPLPARSERAALEPVTVPGGLGAHKWRDRRLIDALEAATAPAAPLLVDLDGLVLEVTRANLFAVIGEELVTPPLDGRILPGVTRARVLQAAAEAGIPVLERPLALAELDQAAEIFLSGALRGLEPVTASDDRMRTLEAWFPPLG